MSEFQYTSDPELDILIPSTPLAKLLCNKNLAIIIPLLYCGIMMIISLLFQRVSDFGVGTDFFGSFVPEARQILKGHLPIDPFKGPVYTIVLASLSFIFQDFFYTGIIISVISSGVVIFLSFQIIRKIFNHIFAMVVVLFLLINPSFVQYTYSAGTDMFFNGLTVCALFFLLQGIESRPFLNSSLAGLFSGIAYLTRYNGIFLLIGVLAIVFLYAYTMKKRIFAALIFLSIYLLTITPWGLYCSKEKGDFFYNQNYLNVGYEMYHKLTLDWEGYWYKKDKEFDSMLSVFKKDPLVFSRTIVNNIYNHFCDDMSLLVGWQIGAFVLFGILLTVVAAKPSRYEIFYIIINAALFLTLLVVFYSERFSLFLIPLYLTLAFKTLFMGRWALSRLWPKEIIATIVVALFLWTFTLSFSQNYILIQSDADIASVGRQVNIMVKSMVPGDHQDKILALRKPALAYLTGFDFHALPAAPTYDQFIDKLKQDKVDYLYFGQYESSTRSELKDLLDTTNTHKGLRPLFMLEKPRAVFYRVEGAIN